MESQKIVNIDWETDPIVFIDPLKGSATETFFNAKNWKKLRPIINKDHTVVIKTPEGKYTRGKTNYLIFHYYFGKTLKTGGGVLPLAAADIACFKDNMLFGYQQAQLICKDQKDPLESIDWPGYALSMKKTVDSDAGVPHQFPGYWMPDYLCPDGLPCMQPEKYAFADGIVNRRLYLGQSSYPTNPTTTDPREGFYFYMPVPFGYFETGKINNYDFLKMMFKRTHASNDLFFPNVIEVGEPLVPGNDLHLYDPVLEIKNLQYMMKYYNPGQILHDLKEPVSEFDNHYYSYACYREEPELNNPSYKILLEEVPDKPLISYVTLVPEIFEDSTNISSLPMQASPEPRLEISAILYNSQNANTTVYTFLDAVTAGYEIGDVMVLENIADTWFYDNTNDYPTGKLERYPATAAIEGFTSAGGNRCIELTGNPFGLTDGDYVPRSGVPHGKIGLRKSDRNYLKLWQVIVEPGSELLEKKSHPDPGLEVDFLRRKTDTAYQNFLDGGGNIMHNISDGCPISHDEWMDEKCILVDNLVNVTSVNTAWDKKPTDKWAFEINCEFQRSTEERFPFKVVIVLVHEKSVVFTGKGDKQTALAY